MHKQLPSTKLSRLLIVYLPENAALFERKKNCAAAHTGVVIQLECGHFVVSSLFFPCSSVVVTIIDISVVLTTIDIYCAVANGAVASPTPTSGAVRVSPRSSSFASKPAPRSSQRKRQSQQNSETELPCTPARRQKLSPSVEGLKDSSIPAERQTRQRLKGSPEGPVGSTKGTGGGPGRQAGEQLPIESSQDAERTPAVPCVAEANYVWVQCDLCNKWRELPKGHAVSHQTV